MTARLYKFGGAEADSELPPITPETGSLWPYEPSLAPMQPMADDDPDDALVGMPTTRRFARSLHGIDAAWPAEPEYANPITREDRALTWFDRWWAVWFVLAAIFGALAAVAKIRGWF